MSELTPADFRKARKALGLSQSAMAEALRLSPKNGDRTIRVWESGDTVPGPAQVAVEPAATALSRNDGLLRKMKAHIEGLPDPEHDAQLLEEINAQLGDGK